MLEVIEHPADCIVIDGYVYLGKEKKAGLGKHLSDMLEGKIPIIGVAKNAFADTPEYTELLRGKSRKPLFITAEGMDTEIAKQCIGNMHGRNRIPTLLKRADQLCRMKV